jgi:demethylmenaquinone methyltransferase/2-methoxy-6-polyprenyl-1,4-benzoquinol methylase
MKKENINKIFQSVASKYDLMNDLMSFGLHRNWKKKFVSLIKLNLKKKNIILDLGCGTGDIFYEITKKPFLNDNYLACLVDPNVEMMNHGIKKLKSKNLVWLASYGEKLPFKNNKFDLVTMSFSLRNVEKIHITLNEINRVLKKNGQFLCLEFGKVNNLAINTIYKIYSDNFIPMIGKKVTGNKEAYEYLIESIKKFPSQEKIYKLLKLKKFYKIKYYNLNFGIAVIYSCKKK